MNAATEDPPRLAAVLSDAPARGAFQEGALSVLIPELERHDTRCLILPRRSAEAINVGLLGPNAHLGAVGAADELVEVSAEIGAEDVDAIMPRT